jgi:osmotically-inducible protein OsmY
MNRRELSLYTLIALMPVLGGCALAALGAGAAGGAAVAADRRTTGSVVEDQSIELKAAQALRASESIPSNSNVNVTSYNGSVLLTGEAPSQEVRTAAVELVRNIEKVKRVYDEITIAEPSSMKARGSDALITSRVKTRLLADDQTEGFDIKVVTERGVVYLMGLLSDAEAQNAVDVSKRVEGVQRVVSLFEDPQEASTAQR